jgi:hypothetical protein
MASTVRELPTMAIVWHFARTMLRMLFHELIKCSTFACQIAWYTILYIQYDVILVHCLNMQRNQGHVSGIEACSWNTFYQPVSND